MTLLPHIVDGGGRFRIGRSGSGARGFSVTGRKPNPTPMDWVRSGSLVRDFRNCADEDAVGIAGGNTGPEASGVDDGTAGGAGESGTAATRRSWNSHHPAEAKPTAIRPHATTIQWGRRLANGGSMEFPGCRRSGQTQANPIDLPAGKSFKARGGASSRSG